jgi:hypothetical protein
MAVRLAAVATERRHPHQGGELFMRQAPLFWQVSDQGRRDHRTDPRGRTQQGAEGLPARIVRNQAFQLGVKTRKALVEPVEVGLDIRPGGTGHGA